MKYLRYTGLLMMTCLMSVSFIACSDDDDASAGFPQVSFSGFSDNVIDVPFANFEQTGAYTQEIVLEMEHEASSAYFATAKVNNDLVEEYNAQNGTSYEVMPASVYFAGSDLIIMKGQKKSNVLAVNFSNMYHLTVGKEYLLPIVVTPDKFCETEYGKDSLVCYITMNADRELPYKKGLDLSNSSMSQLLKLPNNEKVSIEDNNFSFECLVYLNALSSSFRSYILSIQGLDSNNGNRNMILPQAFLDNKGTAIANFQQVYNVGQNKKVLPVRKWVRLSFTCDGSKTAQNQEIAYRMYVDGELVDEKAPQYYWGNNVSQKLVAYSFNGIQMGYTNGSYTLNGLLSDFRIWKKCLTQEEIQENLFTPVDPSLYGDMYGYWKLDEAQGGLLHDSSGNERHLEYPSNISVKWGAAF